ncbi:helix-turn-helix domain-containing protein [Flavobacterium artemisiae]|uniref:Helix-turn-helix domain-containing protein n=1 Tax=Flavobacterium artemisiae TaxID=2126556 RepID=A0ABW4HJP3_9FLAO
MQYDKIKIGESVKSQRLAKGWTQHHLSQISGIGLRSIQRIENGEVDARMYTLNILQEKLNFQFDETHFKPSPSPLDYKEKKIARSRFGKIVLSYAAGITIVILAGIFLTRSAAFPETNFESFIFISSIITLFSFMLFYIWKK